MPTTGEFTLGATTGLTTGAATEGTAATAGTQSIGAGAIRRRATLRSAWTSGEAE